MIPFITRSFACGSRGSNTRPNRRFPSADFSRNLERAGRELASKFGLACEVMSFGHQLANAPVAIAFTVVIAFRHIPAVRLQSAAPVEISQISTVRKDLAGAMTGGEMC